MMGIKVSKIFLDLEITVHAPLGRKMENTVIFQLEKISFLNNFCSFQRIELGFSVFCSVDQYLEIC